uniref:Uncharacterized protein n=1 Tax=Picea glauca TaxID=3330 RepID=A0A124GNZ8_PICGL|nr:hypothetical protein ABT39_MTgene249 [Picea glauca]
MRSLISITNCSSYLCLCYCLLLCRHASSTATGSRTTASSTMNLSSFDEIKKSINQ